MIEILGTTFSSILGGGATGLLGVLIQRYFDMKNKSQDLDIVRLNHENLLALRKMEMEQSEKEWQGRRDVAMVERNATVEEAKAVERSVTESSADALMMASLVSDKATYLAPEVQVVNKWAAFMMGTVDWLRGITRPFLTVYLVIISTFMFQWVVALADKYGSTLQGDDLKEIIIQVVSTILYLTTVSTLWWFGTRPVRGPKGGDVAK